MVLGSLGGNHNGIPIPGEKIVGAQRDKFSVDQRGLGLIDVLGHLTIRVADEHGHFAGAIGAMCV